MFENENKTYRLMAPKLQRIVIADPNPNNSRMLTEILRDIARSNVWVAPTVDRAMKLVQSCDPQVIFSELADDNFNGLDFVRRVRRSDFAARQAPVIMTTGGATAASILAARDAGVHEFLRMPYSLKDLVRRLEVVTLRGRDWIEAVNYIGPDRRRFNSGEYDGPLKRRSDGDETPHQARVNQALKIIKSAVASVETDRDQAVRALLTQATSLQAISTDFHMTLAASEFYRHLTLAVQRGGEFKQAQTESWAKPLLAFLSKSEEEAEAA